MDRSKLFGPKPQRLLRLSHPATELLLLLSGAPFLLQFLGGWKMPLTGPEPRALVLAGLLCGSLVILEGLTVGASITLGRSSPNFRKASSAFATAALFSSVLNAALLFHLMRNGASAGPLDALVEVGRFGIAGFLFWALWRAHRGHPTAVHRSLPSAAALGLAAVLLASFVEPLVARAEGLARPWQLVPLLVLLASTVPFTGALTDRSRDELSTRLGLCLVPQIVAQIHFVTGARAPFDHHFTATLLLHLIADLIVFLTLAKNGLARFHKGALAINRLEETLSRSTQDLAKSQQLLVAESEGRSAAERTLRFLQTAIETTQVGVVVSDLNGEILYANPGQARMHGLEVADLLGKSANLLAPEELRRPLRPGDHEDTGGFQRESINQHRDGSRFPVLLTSDLVRDETGLPVARVTIAEDLSDRKETERELLQRGAVLGAISSAAAALLQGRDFESGIQDSLALLGAAFEVHRVFAFEQTLDEPDQGVLTLRFGWGISQQRPDVPESFSSLTLERERELAFLASLREGEGRWGTLKELGEQLPEPFRKMGDISLLLQPVFARDRWWGIIGISDTREREWSVAEVEGLRTAAELLGAAVFRNDSEQALRESEQRFRAFFESSTDLIQSVLADGRFSYVNQAWKDTLGYSDEEIQNLRVWDVVAPEHRPDFQANFEKMLAGQGSDRIETVFVSKHGRHVAVEGSTNNEISAERALSIRSIFRDISQRLRIERMKGEFVAIVSHELRTPLTSIHAGLRLLRTKHLHSLSFSGQQLVELAHQNSQRLGRLIEDVIDVERLDSGRLTFHLETHHLTQLISQAMEETQAFATRLGVGLVQRPVSAPYRVRVDGGRLVQVLKNLLTNAIKFSPDHGLVEVVASRDAHRFRVEVRDAGPGISQEYREKVFERFFQIAPSETRSQDGTGLGLNIARAIIERLGGDIGFESPASGGTTFYFHLPAAEPGSTAAPPS